MLKIGEKKKPLVNLRKWGKQIRLNRDTMDAMNNNKNTESEVTEEETFLQPLMSLQAQYILATHYTLHKAVYYINIM